MKPFFGWFHHRVHSTTARQSARCPALSERQPLNFKPGFTALEERCLLAVDSILAWNDIMLQANANDYSTSSPEQGGPVLTARAFAIVSAAMYDAYNSIEHIGDPYLVRAPRAERADSDAAVAQAAHDTLAALFPSQRHSFDTALTASLKQVRDGGGESQGRMVGAFVANQVLLARADDGATDLGTPPYVSSGQPGFYAPDPLHPTQVAYGPGAAGITPFAVSSADQFAARRLDDGTTAGRAEFLKSQEYTQAYNEVLALGGAKSTKRTAEQTIIGLFWAYDGRPGLGTPPRLYNQIVRTVALQEGNTEAENARLFALVNIAMADAGITCWYDKYEADFWRPITAIRDGSRDGNPRTIGDPGWRPLGAPASNPRPGETDFTPPFPSYTSGHATFGAAAFQTLARFYGRDDIAFRITSDEFNGVTVGSDGKVRPVVTRTYNSFTEAKLENAQSRIYLGIHWAFDRDEGIICGDKVANDVFDTILQPGCGRWDGGPRHAAPSATLPTVSAPADSEAISVYVPIGASDLITLDTTTTPAKARSRTAGGSASSRIP
jgi:hypothetical protein